MSKKILILSILIAILFAGYLYISNSQKSAIPQTPALTTNTLTEPQLATKISKCQAIRVDNTDIQAYLPDPECTPGAIDPKVTQQNLSTTICKSGYTTTVRPPASYTNKLKVQQIAEYGYTDVNVKNYEEDHFISLELGGSPADPKNLWPEPHGSPNEKDKVENYLHKQICSGSITLSEAQKEITANWYTIYKQL